MDYMFITWMHALSGQSMDCLNSHFELDIYICTPLTMHEQQKGTYGIMAFHFN